MLRKIAVGLVAALVLGSVMLAGCSGGMKRGSTPVTGKAPLQIPATYENERAKREFGLKAVIDGYYQEAAQILQESVENDPNAEAFSRLGTARYQLGQYDGAVAAWTRAADLDPKMAGEAQNNIGNALRDLSRIDDAKEAYRMALDLDPTRWTAAVNLASLLRSEDELAEAVKVLEHAAEKNQNIEPLAILLNSYKEELRLS